MMNSSWQKLVAENYKSYPINSERELRTAKELWSVYRVHPSLMSELLFQLTWLTRGVAANDVENVANRTARMLYGVIAVAVEFDLPLDALFNEIHASKVGNFDPDIARVLRK